MAHAPAVHLLFIRVLLRAIVMINTRRCHGHNKHVEPLSSNMFAENTGFPANAITPVVAVDR